MRNDGAMNETPWERLYRLIEARRQQLGLARSGLNALGGPSSEWVRQLQYETGKPSTKRANAMRSLDRVLGWDSGTAWGLVNDDRAKWSEDALRDEELRLIYMDDMQGLEEEIRTFQTAVAARLRNMPKVEAEAAMRKVFAILGGFE